MVFDKVKAIIVDQLGLEPDQVTMDSYFIDDLGADSIDVMEMIMAFETEFGAEVSEDNLENIKQVKDVVSYFEQNMSK